MSNKIMFFTIIEVSYVHKVLYLDGAGLEYHFKVGYFIDQGGEETVVDIYPTSIQHLKDLPEIHPDTAVTVMTEDGSVIEQHSVNDLK